MLESSVTAPAASEPSTQQNFAAEFPLILGSSTKRLINSVAPGKFGCVRSHNIHSFSSNFIHCNRNGRALVPISQRKSSADLSSNSIIIHFESGLPWHMGSLWVPLQKHTANAAKTDAPDNSKTFHHQRMLQYSIRIPQLSM